MIGIIVVNFRRPAETLQCLRALERCTTRLSFTVVLFDNAPLGAAEQDQLDDFMRTRAQWQHLRNDTNLGFAAACNRAIGEVLQQPDIASVVLLNNDTLVQPGWLDAWPGVSASHAMAAVPMYCMQQPANVDSLGVALYQSGLAANRMQAQTPLLGPCGGAACYTADMLRTVSKRTGEIFPESFFCYAEDTDLAARAALLGFDCVQLDGPGVLHHGSLSSGGGDSEFVMRHGLGNSLRVMHRTLPLRLLLANLGWMLLAQLGILAKYVRRGRFRLLLSVFGDFFRAWSEDARMRTRLRRAGLLRACALRGRIARGIYPPSYLKREFTRLFARDRASSEPIAR